jgi:hypothetical protein
MKTVWQWKKTYSGLRSAAGLATMEDLWRFARWVADHLDQAITVDGVEFATANTSSLESKGDLTQSIVLKQQSPQYGFDRSAGAALVADLANYARWLDEQLAQEKTTPEGEVKILAAKPGHLPVPQHGGLLLRRELLAFIRAVARRIGFGVTCDDVIGTHEDYRSFTVRRQTRPAGVARLTLERMTKAINGLICRERISTASPGNHVIKTVTTDSYANGSVVSSVEASGVIQTYEEGETPDACAALVYDSNYDPEFDYGEFDSSSASETLVSYSDFLSTVLSAMLALSETAQTATTTWQRDEWEAASDATTGWNALLTPLIGVGGSEGADNCIAGSMRWRAVNAGDCDLHIFWRLEKVVDESLVTSGDFTLAPGETGDWIGPPSASADLLDGKQYRITRVRLHDY